MIDLKQFTLASRRDDDAVMVMHKGCGDMQAVTNMDEALDWAGSHVCGS